jgi:homoserine O-succinyltransferase
MPILLDRGRIPPRWAERISFHPVLSIDTYGRRTDCIKIALVINMPDPALEDTEMQFFELLEAASGDIPVRIQLYSLPGIVRGERGQQHLDKFYEDFGDLWNTRFEAVIVTGTEPHCPNLREEPYWPRLTELLDWAERNTLSAVLSCLAAHAGVLHSDGIERHRLDDKRFGVFDFTKAPYHLLTGHNSDHVRFPHSRWNEVREDELRECGYTVITKSAEAGVDSFAKRKMNSLFVHFQGHPEYGSRTLLKEYRRDIKRFLCGERDSYPSLPKGYFDAAATRLLSDFRKSVLSNRREEMIADFPESAVVETLQNGWNSSANTIYRNWLEYVRTRKAERPAYVHVTGYDKAQRKGSATL